MDSQAQPDDGMPRNVYDEVVEGSGVYFARKGRFIISGSSRSSDEQRDFIKNCAASKAILLASVEKHVNELDAQLLKYNPLNMLSNLAIANQIVDVDNYKEYEHKGKDAYVEFAAMLYLTHQVSEIDWDSALLIDGPVIENIQTKIDDLFRETAIYLMFSGLSEHGDVPDAISDFRIRTLLNSLIVRYPMYAHHHREILTGIFSPIEDELVKVLGFSLADALAVSDAFSKLGSTRLVEVLHSIQKQIKGLAEAVQKYRKRKVVTRGFPAKLIKSLAKMPTQKAKVALKNCEYGYFFSTLGVNLLFTPQEIAVAASTRLERVTAFLSHFSLEFGTVEARYRLPAPTHPLASTPIIRLDSFYYCPVVNSIDWSIRPRIETLFKFTSPECVTHDWRVWESYEGSRSRYLEETTLRYFGAALKHAKVYARLKYSVQIDAKLGEAELDGLIIFDRLLLLVEVKAGSLSLPALRGAKDRMKEEVKELVEHAYKQGLRAERYIRDNDSPTFRLPDKSLVNIDKNTIDEIFLVTVSLESLHSFVTMVYQWKGVGLFREGDLPWAVSLGDLRVITELVEFPSQLIHYIHRRRQLNQVGKLVAHDELDWFGHYLAEGLYFDEYFHDEDGPDRIQLLSYTTEFDSYYLYESGARRLPAERPRQQMPAMMRTTLREIEDAHPYGYLQACLLLLDMSSQARCDFSANVEQLIAKCNLDGHAHDLSMSFDTIKTGLTCLVSPSSLIERAREKLSAYVLLKKYQMKCDSWFGFLILSDGRSLVAGLCIERSPWQENQEFGLLVSRFLPATQ